MISYRVSGVFALRHVILRLLPPPISSLIYSHLPATGNPKSKLFIQPATSMSLPSPSSCPSGPRPRGRRSSATLVGRKCFGVAGVASSSLTMRTGDKFMADVAKDNKTLLDSLPNSAKLELSKWPKPNLSPVRIVKEELKMHTLAIGDGANAVQVAQEPGGVHRQGGAQGGALPSCAFWLVFWSNIKSSLAIWKAFLLFLNHLGKGKNASDQHGWSSGAI